MSFFITEALAEAAPAAAGQPDPLTSLILPIGLVVLFYFFLIRPQSKRHKEHKQMVSGLQKGEEIITTGGMLGKITAVNENFISLEVSRDIIVHVQKASVQSIMPIGTVKEQL